LATILLIIGIGLVIFMIADYFILKKMMDDFEAKITSILDKMKSWFVAVFIDSFSSSEDKDPDPDSGEDPDVL